MNGEAATRHGRSAQARQLVAVIALTGVVLVVEVVGGVMAHSLALISDAGHMLTDLLALVLCLMAVRFSSLPANREKTWGYHRLEILTALVNGAILLAIAIGILVKAAGRFLRPAPVHANLMAGIALAGLIANLAALGILSHRHRSLNIRGARMHLLGDALSSVGVLLAGLLIALTGWSRIDPIVAAAIALVIIVGALRLVREAVDVLLESAPAGIALDEVSAAIRSVPGVIEVHDLHVWSITTGLLALSGHVRVEEARHPESDALLTRIKQTVRDRFGIVHTTLQIESRRYEHVGDVHDHSGGL